MTYHLALNGAPVAETTGTSYVLTRLESNRDYLLTIGARDAAGNETGVGHETTVRTRASWAASAPETEGPTLLKAPAY